MKSVAWLQLLAFLLLVFAQPAQAARALKNVPLAQLLHGENQLTGDNMHNRWYSPGLGKFLQRDPIRYEGGENLYSFGNADPLNSSDPDGLEPKYDQQDWLKGEEGGTVLSTGAFKGSAHRRGSMTNMVVEGAKESAIGTLTALGLLYEGWFGVASKSGALKAAYGIKRRSLQAADLGWNAEKLVIGSIETKGNALRVTVDLIEGANANLFGAMAKLQKTAGAQGMKKVVIDADIVYGKLEGVVRSRWGAYIKETADGIRITLPAR